MPIEASSLPVYINFSLESHSYSERLILRGVRRQLWASYGPTLEPLRRALWRMVTNIHTAFRALRPKRASRFWPLGPLRGLSVILNREIFQRKFFTQNFEAVGEVCSRSMRFTTPQSMRKHRKPWKTNVRIQTLNFQLWILLDFQFRTSTVGLQSNRLAASLLREKTKN